MLVEKVMLAQTGSKDAMQTLVNQFMPLINHYRKKVAPMMSVIAGVK